MFRLVYIGLSLSGVTAFAPGILTDRKGTVAHPQLSNSNCVLHAQMLSGMDSMELVNTAEYCAEEEDICDWQEEDALMNRLESQAHLLESSLDEIQALVYALSDRSEVEKVHSYPTDGGDLNQMTFMGIINTARYCIDEGCDVEYNEALVNTLTEQYSAWNMRLIDTVSSLSHLYNHRSHYAPDLHGEEVDSLMESIGSGSRLMMDYNTEVMALPNGVYEEDYGR
jgi:hypothetical protein